MTPRLLLHTIKRAACVALAGLFFCGQAFPASFKKAGELYFEGGMKAALDEYSAALKPGVAPEVYLNAAFVADEQGEPARARDIMAAALKAYPDDLRVKRLAARAFFSAGEYSRAEELYVSLVKSAAELEVADFVGLARTRLQLKDYAAAAEAAAKAVDMDGTCAAALFYKARAYAEQGKTDDAADAFSKVLEVDPQFLEARRHLATLRISQRRMEDAWNNYQKLAYAEPAVTKFQEIASGLKKNLPVKPAAAVSPTEPAATHRKVERAANISGLPLLRVGIGDTASGKPSDSGEVSFVTSAPFEVLDAKTKKRLMRGPGKVKWRVAVNKTSPKKAVIKDEKGKVRGSFSDAVLIRQASGTDTTVIKSLLLGHGTAWAAIADRELRGDIEVKKLGSRLAVINIVNIEEYVYGVLSSEMPVRFPFEALKAQAVLARTYAVKNMGKHKAEGYDVCDTQHCQVYGGVREESSRGNSAVDATRAEILTYDGKPAQTVFSSNSGGFTQSGVSAGWGDVPYWGVVSDYKKIKEPPSQPYEFDRLYKTMPPAFCEGSFYVKSTNYRWTRVVQVADIAKEIATQKNIGDITAIIPVKRGPSGHLSQMLVKGTKGDFSLDKEYQVRKYLGDGLLRSAAFVMEPLYKDGKPVEYLIYGAGWGHGVGFCQSGSSGRASDGAKYDELLKTYFPGSKLEPIKREK